jgi:hypothetical protein
MFLKISALLLLLPGLAAAAMPGYNWVQSQELYMSLPYRQSVSYPTMGQEKYADTWGFGFRTSGDGEGLSRTAGFQVQRVTVSHGPAGVNDTATFFEVPLGAEYISTPYKKTKYRFTGSLLALLGMCRDSYYMAPMVTVGVISQKDISRRVPEGLSLSLYYRLTDIEIDNLAGQNGMLRPAYGLRLGYVFKGFWLKSQN